MNPKCLSLSVAAPLLISLLSVLCAGEQFGQSGWQSLNSLASKADNEARDVAAGRQNSSRGRLVEWDDDDDDDDDGPEELNSSGETHPLTTLPDPIQDHIQTKIKSLRRREQGGRPPLASLSRLVYHGQVKRNGTVKMHDGIRLLINTHQPLTIGRHASGQLAGVLTLDRPQLEEPQEEPSAPSSRWSDGNRKRDKKEVSSEWRPIVETERASKAEKRAPKASSAGGNSKWKPISLKRMSVGSFSDVKKPNKVTTKSSQSVKSSIEEPFDNDELPAARRDEHEGEGLRRAKSVGSKLKDRWTPVAPDAVNASSPASLAGNQTDSAQRSASDLNYIYSSQPASSEPDWLTSGRQSASGYYSSYVMQPQLQPQPQVSEPSPPVSSIVDTTSGQVPEMIADRVPDAPAATTDYYTPPQVSAARPYGDSGGYHHQSPAPARFQPPSRATSPAQVVRQEHHYHYYAQQPERQVQSAGGSTSVVRELQPLLINQPFVQQPSSTAAPPTQIIREIVREVPVQPLQFQPIPIPLAARFMPALSQPAPLEARELDAGSGYANAPAAQRIMRQFSSSLPTVTVRMAQLPPVPPIRVPVAALQLPTRLAGSSAAPVTRQTGSFVIPPMPRKTTTYLTETQAVPTHTTIMQTTQFTPATRTTVYTTDHQPVRALASAGGYKR